MLASIHPLGERARGNRFWRTAVAHVVGGTVGGAAMGAVAGTVGVVAVAVAGRAHATAFVALACLAGAALDVVRGGRLLPSGRRQVDEDWMGQLRGWVYGLGYGLQLGAGVLTSVTSASTYVVVAVAALMGSTAGGLVVGACFGFARGASLLIVSRVDGPQRLGALHRRLDRAARPARLATASALALTGLALLGATIA